MTEDDIKALRAIRASIDRWRRMLDDAESAKRSERDSILRDLDSDMGEVLHTRYFAFKWWMP